MGNMDLSCLFSCFFPPQTKAIIVYVTSVEEWKDRGYIIRSYDAIFILEKYNPKLDLILSVLRPDNAFILHTFELGNNVIYDLESIEIMRYEDKIISVKTDHKSTLLRLESKLDKVQLCKFKPAYCGIFNQLKLNTTLCLIFVDKRWINGTFELIGVAQSNAIEIQVKGLINIGIEFEHLPNYVEVITKESQQQRFICEKDAFLFEIGFIYNITYQKTTDELYQILECV